MRLGTETGSFTNHLMSRMVVGQPDPAVGMGATVLGWSDRHAGTIIEVGQIGKAVKIVVQQDKSKRTDTNGQSESQTYEYEANPEGQTWVFRQAKNGGWQEVCFNSKTNRWKKTSGRSLRLDERDEYWDPCF